MKNRGLVFLSLAVGLIGIGIGIGSFRQKPAPAAAAEADDPPAPSARQAEMAKLAVAAGAIRRSLDQAPARPAAGPAPAAAPAGPPAPRMTAQQERDGHVARLEASGSAPPEFLASMRSVDKEWRALAATMHADVHMTSWRCFQAGCYSSATFKDDGMIEELGIRASDTKSFHEWPGPKFRSGPIDVPGGTEITWVFFAPEQRNDLSVNDPKTLEK